MKTRLFLLGLLTMLSCDALAVAYYEPIPYYGNNPFIFCTVGVPQDCWVPINPAAGTYAITHHYCFNPVSAALYVRVCPRAFLG